MTKKQYRSAMGKTVDMGSLLLQNEGVRAVGNMGVNARGDVINSNNKVIEKKSRQVQRQNRRTTGLSTTLPSSGTTSAKNTQSEVEQPAVIDDTFDDLPEDNDIVNEEPVTVSATPLGGLASAIARSRTVQQQLEKTPRQLAKQTSGVKKL
jgi:hypothetical protein